MVVVVAVVGGEGVPGYSGLPHAPTPCLSPPLALSHLTSPILLPLGSLGYQRRLHNQFPPFFSVLHWPLGLGELQACPFLDVVFPPLLLSALSSFPCHCALQDGFDQT